MSLMNVVIAMDSFKGSLSSLEAADAVREGILRAHPEAAITILPLADGGEGTVDALIAGLGAERVYAEVSGPLGESVNAVYGQKGDLAVMEMAAASGLPLVPMEKRDGISASTFGVGQMIAHALRKGCRRFVMGIGGSATTDGGMGMLQALGFSFKNAAGQEVGHGAKCLADVASVSAENVLPELKESTFSIACDVNNPLCGPRGTAFVYGPQKGLRDLERTDADMASYARICAAFAGRDMTEYPGAGAAGGLGFAFLTFLNASLHSGVDIVLDTVNIDSALAGADIAVTGEGRIDAQTAMGKAPGGVARRAKAHGCRVLAFSGSVTSDARAVNQQGIDAFFPIMRAPATLEEALDKNNAHNNLADTAEQVFRLL
ncbi:MAG: glycerate kinase [Mailhella sp.]|nr:glycerate kinase [Mailhella sp.]